MPALPELTNRAAPPPTWQIPLELVDPNPYQPRSKIDARSLQELTDSIRDHGLLQPITVRRVPGGRYQLIAGHRRLEAFKRLLAEADGIAEAAERFRTIPAHEKFDVTDEEMALFALVENLQRDELSPLDAALGLARLQEAHHLSTEALSKRTGLEQDRVKRLLRLSRVPKVIQDACHEGVLIDRVDESSGALKLLPSGKPKHERLRLDLMAALEFTRLHAHIAKARPNKADERTSSVIKRALRERWSYRRIQAFCKAALTGGDAETNRNTAPVPSAPTPLFTDGAELRIRRSQLRAATPEERTALTQVLQALLAELTS
jgi:ParB/RepB/Spo0J family partition protein